MSSYLTKYLLRDFNACPTLFYQKFHHPEAFPSADNFATLQGREFEKMVKRCARFANLKEIPYAQNDEEGLRKPFKPFNPDPPFLPRPVSAPRNSSPARTSWRSKARR
jgi:hypothetical protein